MNDNFDRNEDDFAEAAEESRLNPKRTALLRDILRIAENGMSEEQKEVLLARINKLPGDLPNGFRVLVNSLTVNEKLENARTLELRILDSVVEGGKGQPSLLRFLFDTLSMGGKTIRPNPRAVAKRGKVKGITKRQKFVTLHDDGVPFPARVKKKDFKQGYDAWLKEKGHALLARRAEGGVFKVQPGDSYIWRNLPNSRGGTQTRRKWNGLNGKRRRFFEWDRTHGDIEVYDDKGIHLGTMDPLTAKMIKPAGKTKNIKVKLNDELSIIRPV